jgi:hypothetical protein
MMRRPSGILLLDEEEACGVKSDADGTELGRGVARGGNSETEDTENGRVVDRIRGDDGGKSEKRDIPSSVWDIVMIVTWLDSM